jgi:hypothetical protein
MRVRTILLVSLLALVLPATASAHRYYHNKPALASNLEGKIDAFRLNHSRGFLFPGFANAAAVIALQKANYREAQWTTSIDGVPYGEWGSQLFPPPNISAMLTHSRGYGKKMTPGQVLRAWKNKQAYRTALLFPGFTHIGVRYGVMHRHQGDFKGKGRVTVCYVSMSGLP